DSTQDAILAIESMLDYLPDSTDELPHRSVPDDDPERTSLRLLEAIPASSTGSYDVRSIIKEILDQNEFYELRNFWAPHLVTGLGRIDGRVIGVLANQPMIMAGTLDIPSAQKGARFVRFCDAFNIPLLTIVDTPGFLPGKDVEWRGMIRHGAELAFAYASCTTPRICLITRKAYGGAYIVMDSKGMGNDLTLAWPSAEIAVMGSLGAVQILYRRVSTEEQL
ncbi:propionyl-CoA carboxylase beta subunit, partial [mine drainage metagenome]